MLTAAALAAAGWAASARTAPAGVVEGARLPVTAEQVFESGEIVLDWPARLRVQDEDWLVMTLRMDPGAPHGGSARLFETHNVVAVGRLEMPGLNAWIEPVRQPLRPDRPVNFRWAVRADQPGEYRGVLWLSLEIVPLAGGPVETVTLLSRPVTIAADGFLGVPAVVWRWAGGTGAAVSLLLGLISVWPGLRVRLADRRRM